MPLHLRRWSSHLVMRLAKLMPVPCALCGAIGADAICPACCAQFFQKRPPRCMQCATLLPPYARTTQCGDCLKQPPAFDATIAATDYMPPIDQLVLGLKFGAKLALAPLLAEMLRAAILQTHSLALPTRLIAVPLGAQRLAERGFNQALEIAKPLAHQLGIELDSHMVRRQRETQAQALLHPNERHKNLRHAFMVSNNAFARVRDQHIGVIDDVMTTGETLNELAATLKRFGAARVTNFIFARTPPK